jgi:Na+-transporting NADH:ubiquinone oxidoreductase subunit NqrA
MSKNDSGAREIPDYEAFTTIEEVDEEIEKHKQTLVGKDVLEHRMKQDKKEYVGALNEQLKELAEERAHEIDVLSALNQRKVIIANSGSNIIPMPKTA